MVQRQKYKAKLRRKNSRYEILIRMLSKQINAHPIYFINAVYQQH